MITEQHHIVVGDIDVEVVRKDIKNFHLGVYPPNGRVRVAVPLRYDDESIRLAVVSRIGWIRQKQIGFCKQTRQSQREMITGESHYVEGNRYLLDVVESDESPSVSIRNNRRLELRIFPQMNRDQREQLLYKWHRTRLRERLDTLIPHWEQVIGVEIDFAGIKRMKTKWGSCNAPARRVWLNLELAKKPPQCLEYVLVHEIIHFYEEQHNDRFLALMDQFMPQWRVHRDTLNQAPLSHENWIY